MEQREMEVMAELLRQAEQTIDSLTAELLLVRRTNMELHEELRYYRGASSSSPDPLLLPPAQSSSSGDGAARDDDKNLCGSMATECEGGDRLETMERRRKGREQILHDRIDLAVASARKNFEAKLISQTQKPIEVAQTLRDHLDRRNQDVLRLEGELRLAISSHEKDLQKAMSVQIANKQLRQQVAELQLEVRRQEGRLVEVKGVASETIELLTQQLQGACAKIRSLEQGEL